MQKKPSPTDRRRTVVELFVCENGCYRYSVREENTKLTDNSIRKTNELVHWFEAAYTAMV